MSDNVFIGRKVREKLMSGINKVCAAVAPTLGAAGGNAIIETYEQPFQLVTNDGISIAERIKLSDPIESIGRNLLLESISRANKQSGDGSSTTTVLTQKIIEEGYKVIGQVQPIELKKSLEECVPLIEASIKAQTKLITVDEVGAVAAISAEDEKIGALIQEIYQKIGADGILYPDISKTFDDYYTIGTGVKIDGAGFASPYMADINEGGQFINQAKYKNPSILVTKQKISSAMELNDLVKTLYAKEIKELVIFCDEVEATVVPDLVMTRAKQGFKTLVIKLPVLWKDEWFEDVAKMTGATVIDPSAGLSFKTMKLEHLGTCGNIVVDKHDTYLDGIKDIADHIADVSKMDDEGKIRAARLNTKTARLYVGAASDSALAYRRLKIEDARNSAWQSLHGGVCAGGGVALVNASRTLPDTIGGNILKVALEAPLRQICANAGIDLKEVSFVDASNYGWDAKTGETVDMFEAKILDSSNVILNAVRNAISVSSIVLTSETVVTLPKESSIIPHIPQ